MKQWVCAAMLAGLTMGSASAAPVTRSFNVTATSFANFFGEPAPFKTLSADITLTYDTSSSGFYGAPDYFRVVTDGQVNAGPFSATPIAGYFPPNGISNTARVGIGGAINGGNVTLANSNDFYIVFDVDNVQYASITFDTTSQRGIFLSTNALVRETTPSSPVPEPAVWLMLIAGIGVAGSNLRRSRRSFAKA
jgi:hypothetical protein